DWSSDVCSSDLDVVLFDKTGTLTSATHRLTSIFTPEGDDRRVLALAAAVEAESEHPVARAVVEAAAERGAIPSASAFKAMSGRGVEADVDGSRVAVGGPALVAERDIRIPEAVERATEDWKRRGASVLYVIEDGQITGAFSVEDEIRPESRQAVEELQRLGVEVAMITGDARQVAEAVAAELGIERVLAEVLPEDKHSEVA